MIFQPNVDGFKLSIDHFDGLGKSGGKPFGRVIKQQLYENFCMPLPLFCYCFCHVHIATILPVLHVMAKSARNECPVSFSSRSVCNKIFLKRRTLPSSALLPLRSRNKHPKFEIPDKLLVKCCQNMGCNRMNRSIGFTSACAGGVLSRPASAATAQREFAVSALSVARGGP